MSAEAWALVGVVVGAVLGGGAQLVADLIRRKHDRTVLIRDERRRAYTELLSAAFEGQGPLYAARWAIEAMNGAEEPPTRITEQMPSTSAAQSRLALAHARIELVAPEDTYRASEKLYAACMSVMLAEVGDQMLAVKRLAEGQPSSPASPSVTQGFCSPGGMRQRGKSPGSVAGSDPEHPGIRPYPGHVAMSRGSW